MELCMTRRLALAAVLLAAVPITVRAQGTRTTLKSISGEIFPGETPSSFRVENAARAGLQRLWQESTDARAERVACIGGRFEGDSIVVTSVGMLDARGADSTSVSAQQSIDECGPPYFLGTVHTHLNVPDGKSPYSNFSGADRGVMYLWWKRWQEDGFFCLLYSGDRAHCEIVSPGKGVNGHGTPY